MMRQLQLATHNAHKVREFAAILGAEFALRDLSSAAEMAVVEETGETFAENAILKAVAISKLLSGLVVADDSGLEVDALDGAPGVLSARYAGASATDQENIARLLSELRRTASRPPFPARFRCVLALAREGELIDTFEGMIGGVIVGSPRGSAGFGYDSIFQPDGGTKTFAELPAVAKNRISHRARAIRLLHAALRR